MSRRIPSVSACACQSGQSAIRPARCRVSASRSVVTLGRQFEQGGPAVAGVGAALKQARAFESVGIATGAGSVDTDLVAQPRRRSKTSAKTTIVAGLIVQAIATAPLTFARRQRRCHCDCGRSVRRASAPLCHSENRECVMHRPHGTHRRPATVGCAVVAAC